MSITIEKVETSQGPALYFHLNGTVAPMLLAGAQEVDRIAETAAIGLWEGQQPVPPRFYSVGLSGWLERRRERAHLRAWHKSLPLLVKQAKRAAREAT